MLNITTIFTMKKTLVHLPFTIYNVQFPLRWLCVLLCLLCFLCAATNAQEFTFTVDENLPAPKETFYPRSGDVIAQLILNDEQINGKDLQQVIATSFQNDTLVSGGKDVFFHCMVRAYADHRPVCISPDMSAKAGSNVIMPGSKKDYKAVLKALRKGTLSRERAEANVSWLIRTIRKLTGCDS